MTIRFRCEKCHKTVEAPDEAGGRRGRCPYCKNTNYVPAPEAERQEVPLAPLEEDKDTAGAQDREALKALGRELLHEMGSAPQAPLEHKADLSSEDLQHFVVNYCMDMFRGNLDRAEAHVASLRKFKYTAVEAVEDFETGKAIEAVLDVIPTKVRQGFLESLKDRLKA